MTVVGIDTSSKGFHAVSTDPVWMPGVMTNGRAVAGWTELPGTAQERRLAMFRVAKDFFTSLPAGTHVFVEEPLVLRTNTETTRKLVMVGGVIEAAFWQANPDATFYWVDVSTWRKTVLGIGGGKKERMKELARLWVQMNRPELANLVTQEDDLADAACICEYGRLVLT